MDVTSICCAFVDLVTKVSEADLVSVNLTRGTELRIAPERLQDIFSTFVSRGKILPGGPAANSMAGIAALGGKAAFIGKVASDKAGQAFINDFRKRGVHFDVENAPGSGTALCVVFVTPDGERSVMVYNEGVADAVTIKDIERNRQILETTRILYIGLRNLTSESAEAIALARNIASRARTATTLQSWESETEGPELAQLVMTADIIMGNEIECHAFAKDLGYADIAETAKASPEKIFVCTLADKGACVYEGGTPIIIKAYPVSKVADTAGAGDAWAAGFLYGLSQDFSIQRSATIGSACAAKILEEEGGRPTRSWRDIAVTPKAPQFPSPTP